MRGKKEVRVLTVVALLIVLAWNSFNSEDSENISLQSKVDAHIENVDNEAEEGQILYGETGGPNASWVGFFDSYSTVFDYAGEFFLKSSKRMVSLSPDTSEYYIDGEPVSAGEYEEQAKRFNERYKYISLEK